jgi:two-component system, chemotaxis family, chemotaxis protein CheY
VRSLVIDDSKAIRLIIRRTLLELGIEVTEAADGLAALDVIDAGLDPDLIMLDWNMPRMNGIEFLDAVRRPPRRSTAKIVMVTTESEVPRVLRALEAGADEYVMKPFTPDAIADKLRLLGFEL